MFTQQTLTPAKSIIDLAGDIGGKTFRKLSFINRKGTFIYSPACIECKFAGEVQSDLSKELMSPTCDRDMATKSTWRKSTAAYTRTRKRCKYFKLKEELANGSKG